MSQTVIIELDGLLDQAASENALRVAAQCRENGAGRVVFDCNRVTGCLHDAFRHLLTQLDGPDTPLGYEFRAMPAGMAAQYGLYVGDASGARTDRQAVAPSTSSRPVPSSAGSGPAASDRVQSHRAECDACGAALRVGAAGNYACPSCKTRFYADNNGQLTFYESLQS